MGLFSIPMFGISRSKEWVVLCRRKDLMNKEAEYLYKNCRMCAEHFEDVMFANDLKNRLQPQAKPTLFNIPNAPPTVGSERSAIQKVAEYHCKGKMLYISCRGPWSCRQSNFTKLLFSAKRPRVETAEMVQDRTDGNFFLHVLNLKELVKNTLEYEYR